MLSLVAAHLLSPENPIYFLVLSLHFGQIVNRINYQTLSFTNFFALHLFIHFFNFVCFEDARDSNILLIFCIINTKLIKSNFTIVH
jgi:hypothetical protein